MICEYSDLKPVTGYVYGCRCERCSVGSKEYRRARYEKRIKFLQEYKLQKGCTDCGYSENAVALQFDHVEGSKVGNISDLWGTDWNSLLEEVDKCEVVCANCHHIRTALEKGWLNEKEGSIN